MSNPTERITLPSGASYPAYLEPLTEQEQALLDTYAAIKGYEKEAARLKAEEAKRRLEEADERYRSKVREREGTTGDGDEEAVEDEELVSQEDNGSDQEDEETKQKRIQRQREISQLRRDVAAARTAKEDQETKNKVKREKEEALRKELLGEQSPAVETNKRPRDDGESEDDESEEGFEESTFTGPSIKKKRVNNSGWDDFKPQPSLIANIGGDSTPPHDFSKKMGMSKSSLDGTILFPRDGIQPWTPPAKPYDFMDGHLELQLDDFDPAQLGEYGTGNNTLAVKFHAPDDSSRFSVNIASSNDGYNNILFHFNPRHFQKGGQLVSSSLRYASELLSIIITLAFFRYNR
jgi:hypothetical protein